MTKVYFSNGAYAEVDNVRGDDPRTFSIPFQSCSEFDEAVKDEAVKKGAILQFGEEGPVYLLKNMRGFEGTAVLQVTRARP